MSERIMFLFPETRDTSKLNSRIGQVMFHASQAGAEVRGFPYRADMPSGDAVQFMTGPDETAQQRHERLRTLYRQSGFEESVDRTFLPATQVVIVGCPQDGRFLDDVDSEAARAGIPVGFCRTESDAVDYVQTLVTPLQAE